MPLIVSGLREQIERLKRFKPARLHKEILAESAHLLTEEVRKTFPPSESALVVETPTGTDILSKVRLKPRFARRGFSRGFRHYVRRLDDELRRI